MNSKFLIIPLYGKGGTGFVSLLLVKEGWGGFSFFL